MKALLLGVIMALFAPMISQAQLSIGTKDGSLCAAYFADLIKKGTGN